MAMSPPLIDEEAVNELVAFSKDIENLERKWISKYHSTYSKMTLDHAIREGRVTTTMSIQEISTEAQHIQHYFNITLKNLTGAIKNATVTDST